MAEVVNLNKARKAKAKVERATQAKTNRVAFGRTKTMGRSTNVDH